MHILLAHNFMYSHLILSFKVHRLLCNLIFFIGGIASHATFDAECSAIHHLVVLVPLVPYLKRQHNQLETKSAVHGVQVFIWNHTDQMTMEISCQLYRGDRQGKFCQIAHFFLIVDNAI